MDVAGIIIFFGDLCELRLRVFECMGELVNEYTCRKEKERNTLRKRKIWTVWSIEEVRGTRRYRYNDSGCG